VPLSATPIVLFEPPAQPDRVNFATNCITIESATMSQYYPRIFGYDPSLAAAISACIVFAIMSLVHTYQALRSRTWIWLPFVFGCYRK
jgi:Na+/H+ antiporter NhaD/arsenite permease-like protein